MNFFKFFFGILLVQAATYLLILITPAEFNMTGVLRIATPLLFIALIVAFWFNAIAGHHRKDAIGKVKDDFAQEREKLRINAERAKERVIKASHKNIVKETKKAHAKANFKVGVAFAAALGVGALFIFAQMVTAGLLAITATGGVMGGYYWRGKRLENESKKNIDIIDAESTQSKLLEKGKL